MPRRRGPFVRFSLRYIYTLAFAKRTYMCVNVFEQRDETFAGAKYHGVDCRGTR